MNRVDSKIQANPSLYGLMAEFHDPQTLLDGARAAREEGYRRFDAYSPFPVEGLTEAIGLLRSRLSFWVLIGGIIGAAGGYFLQYYASVIAYPLNVGGRPLNSWPSFVPVTFEMTILFAALAAVLGMLVLNKLPKPYHPVFNARNFELASQDRFFLCIEMSDPKFNAEETRDFLRSLGAMEISEVEC
jgi:hypothetical protein